MSAVLLVLTLLARPDTADLAGHVVVLSADDGYHSLYERVFPLLRRYRMTMTVALITGNIGTGRPSYRASGRFLNQAEVREMIGSGSVEVASHTLTHTWLTRLDSAAAWQEIRASKLVLESLFGRGVVSFVYPYGDHDARARRLVQRAGYRVARAVRRGDINLWVDRFRLPEFELRQEVTLGAAKAYIRAHRTSIILFHRIVPRPSVFTEWPAADFSELLDWLHRSGARTVTLGDLYYDWWREAAARLLSGHDPATEARQRLFQEVDVDATRTPHPR
jgi:peptidoglycan/xylan/chitin deacetylase (PgdA/CDA1 family)